MSGKPRTNDVSDDLIVATYERLQSTIQAARELGIGQTTILRVLEKRGVERNGLAIYRQNSRRFTAEKGVDILAAYQQGANFADLVRQFGGSEYTVKRAIKAAGGTLKPVAPPGTPKETEEILRLHEAGLSQMKISVRIGRTQPFVGRVLRRNGINTFKIPKGEKHGHWKGGRIIDEAGYARVRVTSDDEFESMRMHDGYVMEHRLVLARKLGRPLTRTETVHHIDGDKLNNHPDNLQLRQGKHGRHVHMRCADCGSQNVVHVKL